MTRPFQLTLPNFEGSVGALPPLVSTRRVAVDDLSLAAIPVQFLAYVDREGPIDLDAAGDVLAAVARLMLLKSIHLLAHPESDFAGSDDDIHADTRHDVIPLRRTAALLETRQSFHVYPGAIRTGLVNRRTEPRPAHLLARAWGHMRDRERGSTARALVPAFVRLEVAISRIIRGLKASQRIRLTRLISSTSRRDAVMHFIAVLELLRRGEVLAEQNKLFDEIVLAWPEAKRERRTRVG